MTEPNPARAKMIQVYLESIRVNGVSRLADQDITSGKAIMGKFCLAKMVSELDIEKISAELAMVLQQLSCATLALASWELAHRDTQIMTPALIEIVKTKSRELKLAYQDFEHFKLNVLQPKDA